MIWFIFSLVAIFLTVVILFPFTEEKRLSVHSFETPRFRERLALKEEKASLLLALRELDFDFEMGKISKTDYGSMKDKYQAMAVATMKKLESLDAHWKEVGAKIDQKLKTPTVRKGLYCSECGTEIEKKSRYCGNCGFEIKAGARA